MQSAFDVHDVRHDVAAQRYAPQACGACDAHAPAPLQNSLAVCSPDEHCAAAHSFVVGGSAPHAAGLVPSHCARQTPVPEHSVRPPWGCPFVTFVHMPTLPATSHAWHCPPHVELQHTPSTQIPEPHSDDAAQLLPSGSEQVPAPFALHTCAPGHDDTEQQAPFTQFPVAH